jgi:threonine/homoserine/homoserine lactone efflux protein
MRGGFAAQAGLMLGDIVLMFLAAIGVAALLHANPLLFHGLQYMGAAYLAYLGARLLFARGEGGGTVVPFSNAAEFRRGFLVTLFNPKAIVFTWRSSRCSWTPPRNRARSPSSRWAR